MKTTVLVLSSLAVGLLVACEGSEMRRPIGADGFRFDVDADDNTTDVDDDGDDGDDGDTGPDAPTIEVWLLAAGGELGRGVDEVTILAEDEPADYLALPGYQIDVAVATSGVSDGDGVTLYLDDEPVQVLEVTVEDGVGRVDFMRVNLPFVDGGAPLVLRAEVSVGEELVADTLEITLDKAPCLIEAVVASDVEGCAALDPDLIAPPFQAVAIDVTRVAGTCDRVDGVVHLGPMDVGLAEVTFDADGAARLVVPIDPNTTYSGPLVVDLVARKPGDESQTSELTVTALFDHVAPRVRWVRPAATTTALTLDDDEDGDPDNGIQLEIRVNLALDDDETVRVELDRGFTIERNLEDVGPGDVSLGVLDFTEEGPTTLFVYVVDRCGNEATLSLQLDVDPTPDAIAILSPADGAVLLADQDADRATRNVFDTTFVVTSDAAEVGSTIAILCQRADTPSPDQWARVGALTLTAQTPDGRYAVAVAVQVPQLGPAARCVARLDLPEALESLPVRVTFAIPAPTIVITSPDPDACLVTDTVGFEGRATNLDGRDIDVFGVPPDPAAGPIVIAPFSTVDDGDWSATYRVGDDGPYQFSLSASDTFGNPASASVTFTVDRVPPALSFGDLPFVIDAAVTPDVDAAPGFQADLTVSASDATSPEGAEVCLTVSGQQRQCKPFGDAVVFRVTLLPGNGNALSLSGQDGCGIAADPVNRPIALVLDNPLTIVAPADGATLLASGDTNPTTALVYDMNVSVDADNAEVGATLTIECRSAGGADLVAVGARTITSVAGNGVYTIATAIDVGALGTRVQCRAHVDQPTAGFSELVSWTLALPAPRLTVTAPAAGQCFGASATQIAAAGTATALDGRVVTASLLEADGDVGATATGTATASDWAATIALGATLADGSYGIVASASDALGNPASSGAPSGVIIDRTAPTVALTAPTALTIDEADDTSTAAGVQIDVSARYTDARSGGQVCLAVGDAAARCVPALANTVFEDVTVQPGDNTLRLTATDACGNAAAPVTATRTLLLDAPTVAITTPAADLTTAATTITIVVTVTVDGVPLPGADVRLSANGVVQMLTPTAGANGTYTFTNVPLPLGVATRFTAEAERDNAAPGVSGPRIITQKNAKPTIVITTPADDAVLNLDASACDDGEEDCVLTVAATTTNTEPGSAATLTVVCDGERDVYQGTVGNNTVSFADVVLADQGTCTLTPGVTDAVGQTATGAAIEVTIDRVAPTIEITAPPAVLNASDDADAGTAGLQHALVAVLGGVPEDAEVTAVITWNGGADDKTLTHTVTTATDDGDDYTATFGEAGTPTLVTWPEGTVRVEVTVSDEHGNETTAVLTIAVDSDASIRITGPAVTPAETCGSGCASGTACVDGACWIAWGSGASRQLVTVVAGISTTTNNVRACSDHPSLAGGTVCTSAAGPSGPFREVRRTSSSGGITLIDLSSVLPTGTQRLVAEVLPVTGGAWLSSQAASNSGERQRRVVVDLVAPVVTNVTSPSDTLAPSGTLSAAEQAALPRQFDISFTTSEAGRAEVFVNGTVAGTADVAVGSATIRVTLPEGTPQVWVVVTDAVGNRSAAPPANGVSIYQPTVDVTAPTLAFTRPAKSPLIVGDSRDITLTSNGEGRTVTLFDDASDDATDNPVQVATGTVSGGSVTFTFATTPVLSDGVHRLSASVSDAAGNTRSAVTSPTAITVDTVPPSGEITSPADLAIIGTDASPIGGFQVMVTFETEGATRWQLASAEGCDLNHQNCLAPVVETSGNVTNPGGAEPDVMVALDIDAAATQQKIILTTFDANGNTHVYEVRLFIVVTCAVSFNDLPQSRWFNASYCEAPGSCDEAPVDLEVRLVGDCAALAIDRLALFDGDTELASIDAPDASETFTVTFDHGASLVLEAIGFDAADQEVVATGPEAMDVDFHLPTVEFVASDVQGFTTPAEGASVAWGFAEDIDPATPGMQFNAAVRVTDDHADGAKLTELRAGGTDLDPENGDIPLTLSGASPITQALVGMTLADDASHIVTVSGADPAGNTDSSSFTAIVDVTAPDVVVIDGVDVDRRRPRFTLSWDAIGTADDLPVAYEVRYSAQPIASEADWDGACDAEEVFGADPMPAPADPGEVMMFAFGGPDTRPNVDLCRLDVAFDDGTADATVVLYIAVRARDDSGNLSGLDASSVASITHGALANDVSRVVFDNSNGQPFGTNEANAARISRRGVVLGDVTGDGIAEWAVFSINTNGFCVVRGVDDLPDTTTFDDLGGPADDHVCLVGSGAGAFFTGVTQTGHHVAALGDVNADGIVDFGVSGRITNGDTTTKGEGYVAVYLGRDDDQLPTLTAPNLRFRGIGIGSGGNYGAEYSAFCAAGDFDGAAAGTADFAIGEPFESRVHVIPGQAAWTVSTNLTFNLDTAGVLSTTLGAWSVEAPGTWGAGTPPVFGLRCAPAGDVLPTTVGSGAKDDLLVMQGGSDDNRVFLFSGRTITAGAAADQVSETPGGSGEDARSVRLRQEGDQIRTGFGLDLQGGVDLTGDDVPDVLVGHPNRAPSNVVSTVAGDGKSIYVFDGAALAALVGGDVRVGTSGARTDDTWVGDNGFVIFADLNSSFPHGVRAVGDFDGSPAAGAGAVDIAYGDRQGFALYFKVNHVSADDAIALGQFPLLDGEIVNRYRPDGTVNAIGTWVDGGADLSGDGLVDIISGSNLGEVLIVH